MTEFKTRKELLAFIEAEPKLAHLLREVRTRMGRDPAHDLGHSLRVAQWTARLAGPEVPPALAVAAALLHDIVAVSKASPDRPEASARAAEEARDLLPRLGFSGPEVDEVADAVRDHSFSRGAAPAGPLGRALQDADRLDALGAIGLLRTASTGALMGARYFDSEDPWARDRALNEGAFTVDHFFTKLLRLPETMHSEVAQAEARRRVDYLIRFLRQLGDELAEPPPAWRLPPVG